MRRPAGTPKDLVHNNVFNPSVSKAAVLALAKNYVRNLSFYQDYSRELRMLLAYCSQQKNDDVFRYEDFAAYFTGNANRDFHLPEENILKNRAEFQAVFRFLHPSTRLAREEIHLIENQSIVLVRYGTDKVLKQDGIELSHQEFESFPAFRVAAANMRATLALPADQPLKDLFSQNELFETFTENPADIIVEDGILVEKSALIDMINGYYSSNEFYNAFHYLPPFRETEISEATLTQLPVETAEKVRAAKREYLAAQNGDVSLEFLNGTRAILLQMANVQQGGRIFLADNQAEEQLGEFNQGVVLLFANELERCPQLADREIITASAHAVLRLSLSLLLQEQPCIKLRQIYLWKFLWDNRARFPEDQPLVLPPLVRQLCNAERYVFDAMFSDAPAIEDGRRAENPAGFFQAERPAALGPLENEPRRINAVQLDLRRVADTFLAGLQNAAAQQFLAVAQLHNDHIDDRNQITQLVVLPMLLRRLGDLRNWLNARNVHQADPNNRRFGPA